MVSKVLKILYIFVYIIRYYYKYTRISKYSFKIKFMLAWTKANLRIQNQTYFLLVKFINIVRKIPTYFE
jgi:hypothetical protein